MREALDRAADPVSAPPEGGSPMRNILLAAAAAVAASAAAPAEAPSGVSIASGEEMLVRIAQDGAVTVERRGAAGPMSAADSYALAELVGTPVPEGAKTMPPQLVLKGQAPKSVPPPPHGLRVSLRDVAGKTPHDTLLMISNGYGDALRYQAVMRRGDRSAPTDVCLVMPGKPGYEHWPFPIERLDLTALRLVPWKPEDGIICQ
jgi:hypothetical protein